MYRFERLISSQIDMINSFLLISESQMIRSRERSSNAENKREQVFETFIARQSSQFEHVKMKTALNNQEKMTSKIQNVIHRADLVSGRERDRRRERERERSRDRERRDREREQAESKET